MLPQSHVFFCFALIPSLFSGPLWSAIALGGFLPDAPWLAFRTWHWWRRTNSCAILEDYFTQYWQRIWGHSHSFVWSGLVVVIAAAALVSISLTRQKSRNSGTLRAAPGGFSTSSNDTFDLDMVVHEIDGRGRDVSRTSLEAVLDDRMSSTSTSLPQSPVLSPRILAVIAGSPANIEGGTWVMDSPSSQTSTRPTIESSSALGLGGINRSASNGGSQSSGFFDEAIDKARWHREKSRSRMTSLKMLHLSSQAKESAMARSASLARLPSLQPRHCSPPVGHVPSPRSPGCPMPRADESPPDPSVFISIPERSGAQAVYSRGITGSRKLYEAPMTQREDQDNRSASSSSLLLPTDKPQRWNKWPRKEEGTPVAKVSDILPSFDAASISQWLISLGSSWFIHCLVDFLVHCEDAHTHFLPISSLRFFSSVSWWDVGHHATIFAPCEVVFTTIACSVCFARSRFILCRGTFILIVASLFIHLALVWFRAADPNQCDVMVFHTSLPQLNSSTAIVS